MSGKNLLSFHPEARMYTAGFNQYLLVHCHTLAAAFLG